MHRCLGSAVRTQVLRKAHALCPRLLSSVWAGARLKPGGPLKTNKPLKPGTKGLKTKKRISPLGRRKKQEIKDTAEWRRQYLAQSPYCEIGPVLTNHSVPNDCTITADALHERKKRSQGGSLTDPVNCLRACNSCNTRVEDLGEIARGLGLTVYSYENPNEVPLAGTLVQKI